MGNEFMFVDRLTRAKYMVKEYPGAKLRSARSPKRRPTFMKQMGVTLDGYDETGEVGYRKELESSLSLQDAMFLCQYLIDMRTVWLVEHAIASLSDEKTRGIAEDTILHQVKCKYLQEKYGLKVRAIQARKAAAVCHLADLLD